MRFLQGALSAEQIQAISDYLNSFAVSGQQRYATTCAGCHGLDARGGVVHESVRGADPAAITEAILDESSMRFLTCLPSSDVSQIADYLGTLEGEDDEKVEDEHEEAGY